MESERVHPIAFAYQDKGSGWAEAYIADDITEHTLSASAVMADPLDELVCAMARVLRNEKVVYCRWYREPGEERWVFRRKDDSLQIQIFSLPAFQWGITDFEASNAHDQVVFSTTCDLWKFAAKVHLQASRYIADQEHTGGLIVWKGYSEYQHILKLLKERKNKSNKQGRHL